jgi:hypothetical protein
MLEIGSRAQFSIEINEKHIIRLKVQFIELRSILSDEFTDDFAIISSETKSMKICLKQLTQGERELFNAEIHQILIANNIATH